jgi:hypothetical protein
MHTDYVQRKLNRKSSLVEWAVANCKIGSMFSRLQQGVASIVGALTNSGAENTESRRPYVVEETSTSNENSGLSDDDSGSEDGTGQVQLHPPRLRFRIDRVQVNYASPEDYSNSVLKWTSKAYLGKRLFSGPSTGQIGPYSVKEMIDMVQEAADNAGFSVYLHKGVPCHKPNTAKRLTLDFQCDHGRKRYGLDAQHNVEFKKDIQNVVATTVRKQRTTRKNYGYKRAVTAHHRHKCVGCTFSLVINGTQEVNGLLQYIDKERPFMWSACTHKGAKQSIEHCNHVFRGTCTRITSEVSNYLLEHCESSSVPAMVTHVRRQFKVHLDYSRVRYFLLKSGKSDTVGASGGRGNGVSGNALATIKFLLKTKNNSVILLLIHCTSGNWFTGNVSLVADGSVSITASPYTDVDANWKPQPIRNPDADRIVVGTRSGELYFVHTLAWNYHDDARVFEAYPYTVVMDVQANVNNSTDGFNAIGQCGNYHNVVLMRAYIGSQRAETFRWLFKVAFAFLVFNIKGIRAFFVDGWAATISELQALCHAHGMFPNAKIILCMWHLLTDAYDRKFGYAKAASWFKTFKCHMYRLRNSETTEEFEDCKDFVLRHAAASRPNEGDVHYPQQEMVKFIMARVTRPQEWVVAYVLNTCTRGTMSTQQVEGDQGKSRDEGINARCAWKTSTMKHEANHLEKKIKLLHWVDKQLSRKLCRGPTNAADSTVTPEMLALLDSLMLPWAVDEFEVQLLLAMLQTCVFVDFNVHVATFKVFRDDIESENDDGDAADPIREISVNHDDSSSSGEENPENPNKNARMDAGDDAGDDAADAAQSRVDFEFTQNMASEFDRVMAHPLPCDLKFRYKKVRTVKVQLSEDTNGLFSCICSCGYPARIGLACRHILCFLIMIITKLIQKRDATGIFDWTTFPVDFVQLVNMDICSKLRYHAVRHQTQCRTSTNIYAASSCFSMNHGLDFKPKIPASVLRQFLGQFEVEDASKVPAPGVPMHGPPAGRHSHQENSNEQDGQGPAASPRRASARSGSGLREPTEKGFMDYCQRIWDRTKRLRGTEATEARQILQQQMEIADEMVSAIRPSRLPQQMTR